MISTRTSVATNGSVAAAILVTQTTCTIAGGETLLGATTIVLPVHNRERTLDELVWNVLELADSLNQIVEIVIVDDGSQDETFESACALAKNIPQVHAMREPVRRGLKPVLERVRKTLGATSVIAHDGASPIDLRELAALMKDDAAPQDQPDAAYDDRDDETARGSRRFASISALSARMQQAHRSITSFRWMHLREEPGPRRSRTHVDETTSTAVKESARRLS